MSDPLSVDSQRLAQYQRRLLVSALQTPGRVLLVIGLLLFLGGIFGAWTSGQARALTVLAAGALTVIGVALSIADDYLPNVPEGSPAPTAVPGDAATDVAVS